MAETSTKVALVEHPIWCTSVKDSDVDPVVTKDGVRYIGPDHKHQEHEGRVLTVECGDTFDWTVTVQPRGLYEVDAQGAQTRTVTQVALTTYDNASVAQPCTAYLTATEVRQLIKALECTLRDLSLEADRG